MKEKVSIKDNEIQTHERKLGILAMWKEFWNPEPQEESEIEAIMNEEELTKETKELLIKSLKNAEKIMKPSDGNSYRTAKLKVDARESKEYQEEHPVSIKKNSKSKANQEKEMVE